MLFPAPAALEIPRICALTPITHHAEEWLWQRPATPASRAGATPDGRGLRVVVGECFMQAVDGHPSLPPGTSLAELVARLGADAATLPNLASGRDRCGQTRLIPARPLQ